MKRICLLILIFCLSIFIPNLPLQAQLSSSQLNTLVQNSLKKFNVAGVAVAIVKDGKVIYEKGFGVKSIATNSPVDVHTNFQIASNSKAFTTAALSILIDEKKMKIKLWGVRGSFQTSDAETKNFGTRTSCTMVLEDGELLILDTGSGNQHFNSLNFSVKRVDILLTHLHMDHILGLGFFSPIFIASLEVHIWGPKTSAQSLRSRLSRYLSPPLFPVLLRDLPCNLIFHEIGNTEFEIKHFKIKSNYIIHPGPTIDFKVTGNNSVFTYTPDHEPALGSDGIITNPKWISGFDLASNADLLYHDGQYTSEEYKTKKGWGHSCIKDALEYASLCKVKNILLAHHDPAHSDEQLNKIFLNIQSNYKVLTKYEMAKEGDEIDLP